MEMHNHNLNIHYSAPKEVWDKLGKLYEEMPYWNSYVNGCPQWYGKNEKLIDVSVEPSGLQFYAELPGDEWNAWFELFKKKGGIMMEMTNRVTPWSEDAMKNYQWLDEYLLKQPATVKEFQPSWQAYKYLLRSKMYAYIGINDQNGRPIITLKLEPLYSDMLRCKYDDIVPGYYMNKLYWSSVYLDGDVPQEVLADMIRASYKEVLSSLSKKAQREILGELDSNSKQ